MSESGSGSESGSESIPVLVGSWSSRTAQTSLPSCVRIENNTVAAPGFSCPNPMPPPFDTETDSDPDPDLASSLTFSDSA
ncbi:MAG: hypothetical protein ACOX52_10475 [Verrucomicrobiota bacterium]